MPTESIDRVVAGAGSLVRLLAADDMTLGLQSHPAHTVLTVLEGEITASTEPGSQIVRRGESLLVDPNKAHAVHVFDARVLAVELAPRVFDELLVEMGWWRPGTIPVFRGDLVQDPVIESIARSLADEVADELPGQGPMMEGLVRQLAVHLLRVHLRVRHVPDIELSRVGPVDRRLRRAIELMHDHCAAELSLKELAAAVFLSEHYFAHLFKDVTGLTPHAYLVNLRVDRARALLAETETPITEIAAEVGYRSPSHFAHAFRAAVGTSPRAYRAAAKGKARGFSAPVQLATGVSDEGAFA